MTAKVKSQKQDVTNNSENLKDTEKIKIAEASTEPIKKTSRFKSIKLLRKSRSNNDQTIKTPASFREQAKRTAEKSAKTSKIRRLKQGAAAPARLAQTIAKKQYHLSPNKNNDGKFLHKSRSIAPRYFRDSLKELRQVTWTTRRETLRLTVSVMMFAIIFGIIIAFTDYGLDKLFRKVILK